MYLNSKGYFSITINGYHKLNNKKTLFLNFIHTCVTLKKYTNTEYNKKVKYSKIIKKYDLNQIESCIDYYLVSFYMLPII